MSIEMGNDEFILYVRKTYCNCLIPNDTLGRLIWARIKELDPEALIIEEDTPCYWASSGNFVSEIRLPKTAAQVKKLMRLRDGELNLDWRTLRMRG